VGEGEAEETGVSAGSQGLAALFDALNGRHFGGRLPKYRVVCSRLPGLCSGKDDEDRHLIRLSGGLSPEMRRRILLHEMCHIGIPGHGTRWQARMLRLADQGEAWAHDEVHEYRTNTKTPREMWVAIKDALHSL